MWFYICLVFVRALNLSRKPHFLKLPNVCSSLTSSLPLQRVWKPDNNKHQHINHKPRNSKPRQRTLTEPQRTLNTTFKNTGFFSKPAFSSACKTRLHRESRCEILARGPPSGRFFVFTATGFYLKSGFRVWGAVAVSPSEI